jgi:hypothetical protein
MVRPMAGRIPRKEIARVRGSRCDGPFVNHASRRAVSSLLNSLGLPEPFDAFMH